MDHGRLIVSKVGCALNFRAMLIEVTDTNCPRCRKPIRFAAIEPHPSRSDIAHQNYQCEDCGPVLTKVISLRPDKPGPSA
jgi:transposase-like protein